MRRSARRFLRTLLGSFRVRLVLAFSLVVMVALLIVLATLPRLLDGYFAQQDQQSLGSRAEAMAALVQTQLQQYTTLDGPHPILVGTGPLHASFTVERALGTTDAGFVHQLTPQVALADVTVELATSAAEPTPVYSLNVPLDASSAQPGQTREGITASATRTVADPWYTQTEAGQPQRVVTVTLSQPFTYRTQTVQTIAGVMLSAGIIALVVAIIASVLLAQWLTTPVRRLTNASRALAEGRLDVRVSAPASGSPELAELARAFNAMAARLQESIGVISQDRDRSREFLADVSHELRTPIAALRTFNELLREGAAEDPDTRDEFLEQSARQIERLDWLATNLLELSKLDLGLVALDLRPDDLRAVVENAVQQAQPTAERKGIDLVMNLPDGPVRQLHDPPRIGQVLSNLIGNAIKFTPSGGRVDVDLEATPDGAELTVTDTGVGISADELPHVFERFWRGARTPELRASGSGLGLAIVKSIVDMHDGRVSILSAAGTGTRVTVDLPRLVSDSSPSRSPG